MPDFTPSGRQRVIAATKWVEGSLRSRVPPRGRWNGLDDPGAWFQLNAYLAPSGSAEAYRVKWDATAAGGDGEYAADTGQTFTVKDLTGCHEAGKYEWVFCTPIGSRNGTVWEVVDVWGCVVSFTLTADISAGTAAATLDGFDGTADGAYSAGSTAITVRDYRGIFAGGKSGAKGYARVRRTQNGAAYEILQLECK